MPRAHGRFPRAAGLAAAVALLTALPAAAADLVVIESNVPGIAAGSIVSEAQSVNLDGSARIVMIGPDGSTRAVAGPYSGPIGRATARSAGALEKLTSGRDGDNHVVGAIRGAKIDDVGVSN